MATKQMERLETQYVIRYQWQGESHVTQPIADKEEANTLLIEARKKFPSAGLEVCRVWVR